MEPEEVLDRDPVEADVFAPRPSQWARPAGLAPLLVLVGISVVERFDDGAFSVLAPEIRHAFHLSRGGYVLIATLTSVLPLFLSVPMGHLGDRRNRIRLSQLGALIWGVTAVATGLAPILALFFLARLLGGVGQLVNEPVHPSLLADWYDKASLPPIYAGYRILSSALALVGAPAAGIIADRYGWRTAFVVLAVPTFAMVLVLFRIREPARGGSLEASADGALSMRAAYRRLRDVRSLRRTWVSAFILGGAVLPFDNFLSLYFSDVFHLSAPARGLITSLFGIAAIVGLLIGSKLAKQQVTRDRPDRLALVTGSAALFFAGGIFLLAVAPALWFAVTSVFLLSIGASSFLPSYQTMVAMVAPAGIRSQAFAWSLLWFSFGAIVIGTAVGKSADIIGERGAFDILGGLVLAAGAVACTCQQFVNRDLERVAADG